MYNKAIIMGRLTADPELRQTPNGHSVTSFSVAVDRPFTGKDGTKEVDFLEVVAWRGTAEFICKWFKKGNPILVDGSIQTRQYTDKNGNDRRTHEIVADSVSFTGSKMNEVSDLEPKPQTQKTEDTADFAEIEDDGDFAEIEDDGDLPF